MRFEVGQVVVWHRQARGGYGYVQRHPATVRGVTPKRVLISVTRPDGAVIYRSVMPKSLSGVGAAVSQR